jgi:plastocyanin
MTMSNMTVARFRNLWLVALSLGIATVSASCGSDQRGRSDQNETPTTTPITTSTPVATDITATGSLPSVAVAVDIKLLAFAPPSVLVKAGTAVTWTQSDPGRHTITTGTVIQGGSGVSTNADGVIESGDLETGATFTHTFDRAGSFTYFCRLHPATMRGEVIVE